MALASKTGEVKFYAKGDKGAPGARMRMREWTAGTRYMQGAGGEEFYDVVVYLDKLYLCLVTHTAATANNPQTSVAQGLGYWEAATDWVFVATKLLLAEKIKAGEIDTDSLVATGLFAPLTSNSNLLRNSGMYDTDGWIGNNSPQSAVFQGYECMKCTGYGYGRYTTDGRNIDYGDLPASGQTVTISADVYVTAPCYLYLGFESRSPSLYVEEPGKWVRVHHTQTIASSNGNFVVYLMSSGVTAYIKNVKLEAGGTATALLHRRRRARTHGHTPEGAQDSAQQREHRSDGRPYRARLHAQPLHLRPQRYAVRIQRQRGHDDQHQRDNRPVQPAVGCQPVRTPHNNCKLFLGQQAGARARGGASPQRQVVLRGRHLQGRTAVQPRSGGTAWLRHALGVLRMDCDEPH